MEWGKNARSLETRINKTIHYLWVVSYKAILPVCRIYKLLTTIIRTSLSKYTEKSRYKPGFRKARCIIDFISTLTQAIEKYYEHSIVSTEYTIRRTGLWEYRLTTTNLRNQRNESTSKSDEIKWDDNADFKSNNHKRRWNGKHKENKRLLKEAKMKGLRINLIKTKCLISPAGDYSRFSQ